MGTKKKEKRRLLLKSKVIDVETTKPHINGVAYSESNTPQNLAGSFISGDEKDIERIARHIPINNKLPISDTIGSISA